MKELEEVKQTLDEVLDYLKGNNVQLVGEELQTKVFITQKRVENLILHDVIYRRELLLAAICEYNKYSKQTEIKPVDDWLENWWGSK